MFPTIRQAARYSGISEHWIREQVRVGLLPTYQIEPQSWPRVSLEELVALVKGRRVITTDIRG